MGNANRQKNCNEFPFYIECSCGELAQLVPYRNKEYICLKCGSYFKRVVGGYIKIKNLSHF